MTAASLDTLAIVRKLKASGLPNDQAGAIITQNRKVHAMMSIKNYTSKGRLFLKRTTSRLYQISGHFIATEILKRISSHHSNNYNTETPRIFTEMSHKYNEQVQVRRVYDDKDASLIDEDIFTEDDYITLLNLQIIDLIAEAKRLCKSLDDTFEYVTLECAKIRSHA